MLSGRDEAPLSRQVLRAGPLTAELEGVDLRRIRLGDREVVRRLFVAVRDETWGTVPAQIETLEVDVGPRQFHVAIAALHEAGDLCFRWHGDIVGARDGVITCSFCGRAETAFRYCRIGLCLLHPREQAGRPYRASTASGMAAGLLPELVGAQRVENGTLYPLFPSYDALEIDVTPGLIARFEFEGDLFEMEDQRNWTDASFKTYSTPIELGFPRYACPEQEISQSVRIAVTGASREAVHGDRVVRIVVGESTGVGLPPFGLSLPADAAPPSAHELELLRALRLDHLRAELELFQGWQSQLDRATTSARALDVDLELVVRLREGCEKGLDALAALLPGTGVRVPRVLVLADGEDVTATPWVRLVRERLAHALPDAKLAGGTDLWFAQLNQGLPDLNGLDGLFYSIAATVHAADDLSVLETPGGAGDTVRSARALAAGRDVFVGPISLRPRAWPFGALEGEHGLPFSVDIRQPSLLAAAWTVASLAEIAGAGPASLTIFETTGWRGVLEGRAGSLSPLVFHSRPGEVFPLYHVLADYGEWRRNGELHLVHASQPLAVGALAVRAERRLHVLVANLTAEPQRAVVCPLAAKEADVRVLDEKTGQRASVSPLAVRDERERHVLGKGGELELELAPYAVVRIDAV